MKTIEAIGFTGGVINVLAGIPQIWKCLKTGETQAISWMMLICVIGGSTFSLAYGILIVQAAIYVPTSLSILEFFILILLKFYYEVFLPRGDFSIMRQSTTCTTHDDENQNLRFDQLP